MLNALHADHGRSDWLGYWVQFVQKARFKKLAFLCHIKQKRPNLSESSWYALFIRVYRDLRTPYCV